MHSLNVITKKKKIKKIRLPLSSETVIICVHDMAVILGQAFFKKNILVGIYLNLKRHYDIPAGQLNVKNIWVLACSAGKIGKFRHVIVIQRKKK